MKHFLHRLFWTAASYFAVVGIVLHVLAQNNLDKYQMLSERAVFGGDLDYLLVDQANSMSIWGTIALVIAGWNASLGLSTWLLVRKEMRAMSYEVIGVNP